MTSEPSAQNPPARRFRNVILALECRSEDPGRGVRGRTYASTETPIGPGSTSIPCVNPLDSADGNDLPRTLVSVHELMAGVLREGGPFV